MRPGQTRRRAGSWSNDRGAAFLLAVYMSALVLLLLGSVSLQRTTTEVRAAQVSRDLQQAFWYAEGSLDSAIRSGQAASMDNLTTKAIASLPDRGSIRVVPTHARIFNNNRGRRNRVHKQEFNPYQSVTRKIVATGTSDASGRRQSVAAYVLETGPLRGVWANRTIAVGAGEGIDPGDVFLSGDLYSRVGAVVSEIDGNRQITFDGIIGVPPSLAQDNTEAGFQDKLDHWSGVASPELKGIKDGYELLHGLHECREHDGGSYSNVSFVSEAGSAGSSHVDGSLSVGISDTPELMTSRTCNAHVTLDTSTVVVDNNFNCDSEGTDTPGLSCSRLIRDRAQRRGEIIFCAASLTPGGADPNQAMLTSLAVDPPHLIFRQPTTIILTGSADFDVRGKILRLASGAGLPLTEHILDFIAAATGRRLKTDWRTSLTAKLSGVNALGETVPVDILQAEARRVRTADETQPGMVFMKPGDQYRGSIYAPAGLVVVRSRDCSVAGCSEALNMDYVVGDEVIVELESDTLQIGDSVRAELENGDDEARFLSWANDVPPPVDNAAVTSAKMVAQ
jgi:Tfp pilus assembly protein PilX